MPFSRDRLGPEYASSHQNTQYDGGMDDRRRNDDERRRHDHRSSHGRNYYSRDQSRDRDRYRDRDRDRNRDRERDRDRYERRRRSRSRSRSRRRSFSPKEGDVIPLSKWPRRKNLWDIPPAGYEHLNPVQAKASGLFQKGPDGIFVLIAAQPSTSQNQSGANPKSVKSIYCGNLPINATDMDLKRLFNELLKGKPMVEPGNCVVDVNLFPEKNYAFVEFRTHEEATAAMDFDGTPFQGAVLKLRRPKDYQPPTGPSQAAVESYYNPVSESPSRLHITNIPIYLSEEKVKDLLKSFGDLRSFSLKKDQQTGESLGEVLVEYLDKSMADAAMEQLQGMKLGQNQLKVEKHKIVKAAKAQKLPPASLLNVLTANPADAVPSPVIQLLNLVRWEELENEELYEELVDDITKEMAKYGNLKSYMIPRPSDDGDQSGVEKVYLEYENDVIAKKALDAVCGRKFAKRVVIGSFYPVEKYLAGEY